MSGGRNSSFLAIRQRELWSEIASYPKMERIQKSIGCKTCQIHTGHLFETHKGGTYWDREGRRRHFQRTRSEDFSFARQALSWTASEEPAWSSSLEEGGGGGDHV